MFLFRRFASSASTTVASSGADASVAAEDADIAKMESSIDTMAHSIGADLKQPAGREHEERKDRKLDEGKDVTMVEEERQVAEHKEKKEEKRGQEPPSAHDWMSIALSRTKSGMPNCSYCSAPTGLCVHTGKVSSSVTALVVEVYVDYFLCSDTVCSLPPSLPPLSLTTHSLARAFYTSIRCTRHSCISECSH